MAKMAWANLIGACGIGMLLTGCNCCNKQNTKPPYAGGKADAGMGIFQNKRNSGNAAPLTGMPLNSPGSFNATGTGTGSMPAPSAAPATPLGMSGTGSNDFGAYNNPAMMPASASNMPSMNPNPALGPNPALSASANSMPYMNPNPSLNPSPALSTSAANNPAPGGNVPLPTTMPTVPSMGGNASLLSSTSPGLPSPDLGGNPTMMTGGTAAGLTSAAAGTKSPSLPIIQQTSLRADDLSGVKSVGYQESDLEPASKSSMSSASNGPMLPPPPQPSPSAYASPADSSTTINQPKLTNSANPSPQLDSVPLPPIPPSPSGNSDDPLADPPPPVSSGPSSSLPGQGAKNISSSSGRTSIGPAYLYNK